MKVYPEVSGLASWIENCKWYFVSQSSEFCCHNPLCYFSMSVSCCFVIDSVWILLDIPSCHALSKWSGSLAH
jgi:hypothetical protein